MSQTFRRGLICFDLFSFLIDFFEVVRPPCEELRMEEVESKLRQLVKLQKWLSQLQGRLDTYLGYQEPAQRIISRNLKNGA